MWMNIKRYVGYLDSWSLIHPLICVRYAPTRSNECFAIINEGSGIIWKMKEHGELKGGKKREREREIEREPPYLEMTNARKQGGNLYLPCSYTLIYLDMYKASFALFLSFSSIFPYCNFFFVALICVFRFFAKTRSIPYTFFYLFFFFFFFFFLTSRNISL